MRKPSPMFPEQTPQIEDRRMRFLWIPRWWCPPMTVTTLALQAKLDEPQQRLRDQLRLEGARHRLLGPGPALLHAEALFVIAEAVFLAEAGREHGDFYSLRQRLDSLESFIRAVVHESGRHERAHRL